jgi:hypothetical protein
MAFAHLRARIDAMPLHQVSEKTTPLTKTCVVACRKPFGALPG